MPKTPINAPSNDFRAQILYFESILWHVIAGSLSFFTFIVLDRVRNAYMTEDVLRSAITTFGHATPYIEFYPLAIASAIAAIPVLLFLDGANKSISVAAAAVPFSIFTAWQFACFEFNLFSLGLAAAHLLCLSVIVWSVSGKLRMRGALLGGKANTYLYSVLVVSIFLCIPMLLLVVKSTFEKEDYLNPATLSYATCLIVFYLAKKHGGKVLGIAAVGTMILFYQPLPEIVINIANIYKSSQSCG